MNKDAVVRLGEGRAVVHHLGLIKRDIDELFVLRLERPDVDEPVLGELVQRHQPFAVGLLGFAH